MSYQPRDVEAEMREGEALFDAALAALRGEQPDSRRAAIQALIEYGATPGERAAAQEALGRLERHEREAQEARDEEEAAAFGEV